MALNSVFINERVRDGLGAPSGDPGGGSGTLYSDLNADSLYVWDSVAGAWEAIVGGGSSGITIGTTTITSGTSGRVLYDNAGVVGEMTTTGSGTVLVLATSPTLVTPLLGTPTSGNLVNCTGYTIGNVAGLGANVGTFLATPSSANLAAAVTDETGSGALVFGTSPTITTSLLFANGQGIFDDAADTFWFRRTTNPQTLYVSNTYTSGASFERFNFGWSSNVFVMRTSSTGTGRNLKIQTGDATDMFEMALSSSDPILVIGNVSLSAVKANGKVQYGGGNALQTATSGTHYEVKYLAAANPSSTSTMVYVPMGITPSINYSAGTPGAGSYEALKIAVTETALPTGTNYLIRASAGAAGTTDKFTVTNAGAVNAIGSETILSGTAIPANGTAGSGYKFSSTSNFGVFFGSSTPSLSAAKGSLYLRSDGTGTTDRAYINTDGGTTWTAITTAG